MQKPIRIVIFDDSSFYRESLKMLFEDHSDFLLIGSFSNALNLIEDITSSQPDVVLMDIDMPSIDGIEATKILKNHFSSLPVIMLTQYEDEDKVINSICVGANGYLLKTSSGEKIKERICEVLNGGSSLDPSVAKKVLELFSKSITMRANEKKYLLSPREKEVLAHLVKGQSYKMIASDLDICYDTVRAHIKSIYQKLEVSSVSGAVAIAVSNNLIPS